MATIRGLYSYTSEILKGTSKDDTFILGPGSEYIFGSSGSDIAMYPYSTESIKSAFYYKKFGIAVVITESLLNTFDVYFLNGIEFLQTLDARVDLSLIGQTGNLDAINPDNAISDYTDNYRTLSSKTKDSNVFFPDLSVIDYGTPFVLTGGPGVDFLFIAYDSSFLTVSEGQKISVFNIRSDGIDRHKIIATDIDIIINTDKAYFHVPSESRWYEVHKDDKVNLLEIPNYTITSSATTINEGATLTTKVETTNVASGSTLHYSLSGTGITAADFSSGALTGSGRFSFAGSFSLSHTFANDLTTEGLETLNIKLFSDAARTIQVGTTASVSIVDTSFALTYFNPSTNKTFNSWTAYQVTNSVKAGDIVNQWFGVETPIALQVQDPTESTLLDITTSSWTEKVKINRVAKASDKGDVIEGKQKETGSSDIVGSVLTGGKGNDRIQAMAGWDMVDGGEGDDLVKTGNGRDILTGGTGRDELWGGFGWNTYKGDKDGFSDLIVIKSDQHLANPTLGNKSGNNSDGLKTDIIENLDSIDKLIIQGVATNQITFASNATAQGLTGIGIYSKGFIEALYTGGDLSVAQLTSMTTGDTSAAVMNNTLTSYGVW